MFQRAFSVSTREQAALLFAPGGHSPTGVFVACCNVGTFVRLCFGVSCGIARARSFVCDHVRARRGRRGHVVAVAVSCPGRRGRRGRPSCRGRGRRAVAVASLGVAVASAFFLLPSCGCDTPMDASVCNGFGVVCVDSICTTYVGRV